ncbi:hypothetical protein [Streptomyces sp. RPT161]|uniref:hypothetical protein n=1 Tax=Streptomyces sp. RPT161 TaxID=3015993 RepID=UPI0022B86A1B|nr:hypothetical protein [Streptomyces sp. RPT161]
MDGDLAQIRDAHRHGTEILIRTDNAGSTEAFLTHLRSLRRQGIQTRFSVGHPVTEPVRRAIQTLPRQVCTRPWNRAAPCAVQPRSQS